MDLWIADVDGVFTNLQAQPNREAIRLSAQICSRHAFTYVTGRGARWLEQHLLPVLAEAYRDYPPRFTLACAEYGGVILRYDGAHGWTKILNSAFQPLPAERHAFVRDMVTQIPGVFYDPDKEVMISVEGDHAVTDPAVKDQGLQDVERMFKGMVEKTPGLEFARTTYACDLIPTGMNKKYGATYILTQLPESPARVHLLGDAPSDLLLADAVWNQRLPYTMHYVGDFARLSHTDLGRYILHPSTQEYDQGTIEVLRRFV